MPHRYIKWDQWIEDIGEQDPCLGRIIREAAVARDAAQDAKADSPKAARRCRKAYASAEQTFETLRLGKVAVNTDAAWKRAADALRKFTEALECALPYEQPTFTGIRRRS